jgi:hypothetical protein
VVPPQARAALHLSVFARLHSFTAASPLQGANRRGVRLDLPVRGLHGLQLWWQSSCVAAWHSLRWKVR